MVDIHHTFTYDSSIIDLFDALTKQEHIKNWWTPIARVHEGLDNEGRVEFDSDFVDWTITDIKSPKLLVWRVVDSSMLGSEDWLNTIITFELHDNGDGTIRLKFSHTGWSGQTECFKKCTDGWAFFLGESLKAYVETGQGKPFKLGSHRG